MNPQDPQAPVAPSEVPPSPEAQPVVNPPQPAPVAPPVAAPVAAPADPFTAAAPIAQTIVDTPAVAPAPVAVGAPAAPTPMPAGAPAAAPAKSSLLSKKMIIMLAAIVGGLAMLTTVIILLFTLVFNAGPRLTTYTSDVFTILSPEGYEKSESTGSVVFTRGEGDIKSRLSVSVALLPDSFDSTALKTLKTMVLDESKLEGSESGIAKNTTISFKNEKKETLKFQGKDARKLTADFVDENGKKLGQVIVLFFVGDDAIGSIAIADSAKEPGLSQKADKIINSLSITGTAEQMSSGANPGVSELFK